VVTARDLSSLDPRKRKLEEKAIAAAMLAAQAEAATKGPKEGEEANTSPLSRSSSKEELDVMKSQEESQRFSFLNYLAPDGYSLEHLHFVLFIFGTKLASIISQLHSFYYFLELF
jgi:hypothetical protein